VPARWRHLYPIVKKDKVKCRDGEVPKQRLILYYEAKTEAHTLL
jgi:hypothetical protein